MINNLYQGCLDRYPMLLLTMSRVYLYLGCLYSLFLPISLGSSEYIRMHYLTKHFPINDSTVLGFSHLLCLAPLIILFDMITISGTDIGAGIGRVSKNVLSKFFQYIDVQDQNDTFLQQARKQLISLSHHCQFRTAYCTPLQLFEPPPAVYDIIWIQWVIAYLKAQDIVVTLNRIRRGLKPAIGRVVIKENIASTSSPAEIDPDDHYVFRSITDWIKLINQSDFRVVSYRKDTRMPTGVMPVAFFFLCPRDSESIPVQTPSVSPDNYTLFTVDPDILAEAKNSIDGAYDEAEIEQLIALKKRIEKTPEEEADEWLAGTATGRYKKKQKAKPKKKSKS